MENHLIAELDTFLAEYCRRTNPHDATHLRELIADDAITNHTGHWQMTHEHLSH